MICITLNTWVVFVIQWINRKTNLNVIVTSCSSIHEMFWTNNANILHHNHCASYIHLYLQFIFFIFKPNKGKRNYTRTQQIFLSSFTIGDKRKFTELYELYIFSLRFPGVPHVNQSKFAHKNWEKSLLEKVNILSDISRKFWGICFVARWMMKRIFVFRKE